LSVATGVSHAQIGDSYNSREYNSREPVACPTGDAADRLRITANDLRLVELAVQPAVKKPVSRLSCTFGG
jgi:hypothetical protein